ncbi:MAG: ATP-binding cassette domain-containing protein [Mariprofundaceae bacterium]
MSVIVEVKNLSKSFGAFIAVDQLSLSLQRGEVLGFLGPNGAGKSTAMKMITGFLPPTSGQVKVCGHDIEQSPIQVKSVIGYLPEGAPAYGDMTAKSFLDFIAEVRGLTGKKKQQSIEAAIEKTHLNSVLHKSIDTLSKGFKRRLGLAQAILHDPEVLVLDEPTDGLDPNQKHEVRELLKEMAKDKAIIISTHILEEVGAICTRAIIIAQGKKLFDGTAHQLEELSPERNAVSLSLALDDLKPSINALKSLKSVQNVEQRGKIIAIYPISGSSIINDIAQLCQDKQWPVNALKVEPVQLERVFRQITTHSEKLKEVRT